LNKPDKATIKLIDTALAEDHVNHDITSQALIPRNERAQARVIAKESGIIAGCTLAEQIFHRVDSKLNVEILIKDGSRVSSGDIVMTIEGNAASILKSERVVLNFLQHLSGITTETARYVKEIDGLKTHILDTRKTIPGLRSLQKYAVHISGAVNHRMHLEDAVLIKNNHITLLKRQQGFSIRSIIETARKNTPHRTPIEIEVRTQDEARQAAESGADIIMLDNMSIPDMRACVEIIKGRSKIEASGGITLDTVRSVAETGVDTISVGSLTHSAKALDIALRIL
jgi:nicotinate-nucleotide pyrophosphorylase (carboxylating)